MRIDVLGVGFDNLTMTEAVAHGSGAAGRNRGATMW